MSKCSLPSTVTSWLSSLHSFLWMVMSQFAFLSSSSESGRVWFKSKCLILAPARPCLFLGQGKFDNNSNLSVLGRNRRSLALKKVSQGREKNYKEEAKKGDKKHWITHPFRFKFSFKIIFWSVFLSSLAF